MADRSGGSLVVTGRNNGAEGRASHCFHRNRNLVAIPHRGAPATTSCGAPKPPRRSAPLSAVRELLRPSGGGARPEGISSSRLGHFPCQSYDWLNDQARRRRDTAAWHSADSTCCPPIPHVGDARRLPTPPASPTSISAFSSSPAHNLSRRRRSPRRRRQQACTCGTLTSSLLFLSNSLFRRY